MGRRQQVVVVAVIASMLAFSRGGWAQGTPAFSGTDWLFTGGDTTSSRYSTLTEVSTETIDRLGARWVSRLEGGASSRSTPAVKDGILYLTAGATVQAFDGATGEHVWTWQEDDAAAQRVPSWQGVGLSDELVFVGLRSTEVAALRQDTGELAWVERVGSIPAQVGETVTTAPIHAAGKVFVGVANGDSGGQGRVVALDAEKRFMILFERHPERQYIEYRVHPGNPGTHR